MRIPLYILFAIAFLASATFAADYTGKVLSSEGKPIKGATVYLFTFPTDATAPTTRRDPATTQTDDAGDYRLPHADSSVGQVVATSSTFGPGAAKIGNGGPSNIRLTLRTDVTLTFQTPDNKPAAGLPIDVARVGIPQVISNVFASWWIPPQYNFPWSATTDANGRCILAGLPQGDQLEIAIDDDRYAPLDSNKRILLAASPKTQADPIHLMLASSISGKVVDGATGKPVSGIIVQAFSGGPGYGRAVTGDDGSYVMTRLLPATYNVEASLSDDEQKKWTAKANEDVVANAGQVATDVNLTLIPGVILTGTVIAGDDGKPVPGVRVGDYGPANPRNRGGQALSTTTDANGTFSLHVPPGEQYVYVMSNTPAPGYGRPSPDNQTVTIADGSTGTVEFRLPRVLMSSITGKVVDPDGNPVAGASVFVSSDLMPMFNRVAVTTNSDGVFQSLPMQRVGRIEIRAKFHDLATSKAVLISQSTGDIVIHLDKNALASISGRVVDPQGNGLDGAPITLDIRMPRESFGQDAGKTDGQGNFKIDSLWPDLGYVVIASRDGYGQSVTNQLHMQPGQDTHIPDLTLFKRDTSITGTLLDENDKPVVGKRVFIRGTKSGSTNINTDANGKFIWAVVSNDPLTIFYNLDGRGPYRRQTVHAGDQNILLHTAPPRPAAPAAPTHVEVATAQPAAAASSDSQTSTPAPAVVYDPAAAATWNGWLYAAITLVICTFITGITSAIFAILKRKTA